MFDDILQLSDIPGPSIFPEELHGSFFDFNNLFSQLSPIQIQIIGRQNRDVILSLAERVNLYRKNIQPEEKVLPELFLRY